MQTWLAGACCPQMPIFQTRPSPTKNTNYARRFLSPVERTILFLIKKESISRSVASFCISRSSKCNGEYKPRARVSLVIVLVKVERTAWFLFSLLFLYLYFVQPDVVSSLWSGQHCKCCVWSDNCINFGVFSGSLRGFCSCSVSGTFPAFHVCQVCIVTDTLFSCQREFRLVKLRRCFSSISSLGHFAQFISSFGFDTVPLDRTFVIKTRSFLFVS